MTSSGVTVLPDILYTSTQQKSEYIGGICPKHQV